MKDLSVHVDKSFSADLDLIVKSVDKEKRTIVAYGSSWNIKDSHGDIMQRGAFKNAIGKTILFLNSHNRYDATQILGAITKMEEDDFGLRFEAKIVEGVNGDHILNLYKEGVPLQHSIGGYYGKSENAVVYDDKVNAYLINEFDLKEISVVPFGSNPNTPAVEVKAEQQEIEKLKKEIDSLKKELESLKQENNKLTIKLVNRL